MAGPLGWFSRESREMEHDGRRALKTLCHHASFRSQTVQCGPGEFIGVVHRHPDGLFSEARTSDDRILTLLYGRAWLPATGGRRLHASHVLDAYRSDGLSSVFGLDGSFVVVIVDWNRSLAFVVGDRIGSMPVVFWRDGSQLVFAPEAKAVLALNGRRPSLDEKATASLVTCGYVIGDRTMFDSMRWLGPGRYLSIDLRTVDAEVKRYWDLRFRPRPMRLADAVERLGEELDHGCQACLDSIDTGFSMLLTGGLDSRTVLGVFEKLGRLPDETLTWGVADSIPASDPRIAAELAARCGARHRFLATDACSFSTQAPLWTYVSELLSDNLGNFAAGPTFFQDLKVTTSAVVIGDQMLGPGGFPLDVDDAVEVATKTPPHGLAPGLGELLRCDSRRLVGELFRHQVDEVITGCSSDHPKDVQDYLYFHLYVCRWLFAPGYFKEPMVSPVRPMMARGLIELSEELPRWLRVDKRILHRLIKRDHSKLARVPTASAHSLIDWDYDMRRDAALRDFLLDLLQFDRLEGSPAGRWLDRDAFEHAVRECFSREPTPVHRGRAPTSTLYSFRKVLSRNAALGRAGRRIEKQARRVLGAQPGAGVDVVLRRLALVSLLQRQIDEGWFGRGGAPPAESFNLNGSGASEKAPKAWEPAARPRAEGRG